MHSIFDSLLLPGPPRVRALRHTIVSLGAGFAALPQWLDAALGCDLCFPSACKHTPAKQYRLAATRDYPPSLRFPWRAASALELRRQLGITYNAAWRMKHKLMQVMKERDDSQPLEGIIQLDDAYWGGERRGGKRGRGAPDKSPFVAAVTTNEEGNPVAMRQS